VTTATCLCPGPLRSCVLLMSPGACFRLTNEQAHAAELAARESKSGSELRAAGPRTQKATTVLSDQLDPMRCAIDVVIHPRGQYAMSFKEEWARHKSAAAARIQMRLNSSDGGGAPSTGGDLFVSSASDKEKAAKYLERDLLPDAVRAGKHAGGATQSVTGMAPAGRVDTVVWAGPGEFDKWEIKAGLNAAMKHWGQQVNNLLARLNGEMGALRAANNLYFENDQHYGSRIHDLIPPGEPGSGVTKDTPSMVTVPEPPPDPYTDPKGPLPLSSSSPTSE